jgi:single-stranded-DNA-specific exonuclease
MGNNGTREWRMASADPVRAALLERELAVSSLIATLLVNRGFTDPGLARGFLAPALRDLENPFSLAGIEAATDRLLKALKDRERVVIYGDYDVDGITGTSLLVNFFKFAGHPASTFIPNRLTDGYGFTEAGIRHFAAMKERGEGADVVITVDHGVSAVDGIRRLRELGIDVIVTDHHEPGPVLPDAVAVVNPKRADCPSKMKALCGVAVAFKLIWATSQRFSRDRRESDAFKSFLLDALSLVGLGTIADVMPLQGDNRIFARHGIEAIRKSTRPGLLALRQVAHLDRGVLGAADVAFRLAPRLNAAGRMGRHELALELLTTESQARAFELAQILETENAKRQKIEGVMVDEALAMLEKDPVHPGDPVVLWSDRWHIGVIGILAARVVDATGSPAVMIAVNGTVGKGSARSVPEVNIHEALSRASSTLTTFGGHKQAAGLEIPPEHLPRFRAELTKAVRDLRNGSKAGEPLTLDLELPFDRLGPELFADLGALHPHGEGNPAPVFLTRGVRVSGSVRTIGRDGKHAAFQVTKDGRVAKAVAYRQARRLAELSSGGACAIAWSPKSGVPSSVAPLEIEIHDFRLEAGASSEAGAGG